MLHLIMMSIEVGRREMGILIFDSKRKEENEEEIADCSLRCVE